MKPKASRLLLASQILLCLSTVPAMAVDRDFDNGAVPADGLWSNPINWTGDLVPGSADNVFVTGNKTITLNYDAPTVNEVSLVRTGNGTVTVNQTDGTLTVNSWFNLGQGFSGGGGTGTWNMSGDSILNSNHSTGGQTVIACGFATSPAYDTGILTLSDTAQFLQTAADFRIGGEFNGTRANGTVTLNNSSVLSLSGAGEFVVGNSGNGSSGALNLNQDAQVQVTTAGFVRVANFAGGTGSVVQSGASIFNTAGGTFNIGDGGTATYTLNSSSQLNRLTVAPETTAGTLNVGAVSGSSGTLTLNNTAQFNTDSVFQVGTGGGTGIVEQNDTSTVTSSGAWFSIGAGGTGSYTMNGGTLGITSPFGLNVGDVAGGTGTMTVAGGTVNAPNLFVGKYGSANGVFSQSNGTVNATGFIRVGDIGTGQLTLSSTGAMNTNVGLQVGTGTGGIGTVNLDGGTLTTPLVSAGTGTSTFNFNGGTLKATVDQLNFMTGLTTATVKSGGAKIDSNGKNITIAQNLLAGSPSGGLTKDGLGALTLAGNNTYTGATTVSAGTLLVNGSLGDTAVTVGASGKLGGSGTIGTGTVLNTLTVNGELAPGTSPGQLTVNDNLDLNGILTMELNGVTAGSSYDQLVLNGAGELGGTLALVWGLSSAPAVNTELLLILNDGADAFTGAFSNAADLSLHTDNLGGQWLLRYSGGTGNDLSLVAVPEPRAALLGGLGLLMLLRRRRN